MIFFFAEKKHCFKGRKQIGKSNTYNSTAHASKCLKPACSPLRTIFHAGFKTTSDP